jgi:hypothetical protein
MKNRSRLMAMEELIVRDEKLLFTIVSYITILMIFINLNFYFSSAIGTIASVIFFLINGTFLGRAFFEKEDLFLRFMLGNLLLVTCLALIAWVVMIIYNLDIERSTLVLCIVTALASLLNKRSKRKNVFQ